MHETGLIRSLIHTALTEANDRGGSLRAIHVRLGALAGGTANHLRHHFEHELASLDLAPVTLHIEEAPLRPSGVELTAVEIAE